MVERDLAKVDVESSNLFTRSILYRGLGRNPKPSFLFKSICHLISTLCAVLKPAYKLGAF
nr:hypothetical protein [uncultured bacterium]